MGGSGCRLRVRVTVGVGWEVGGTFVEGFRIVRHRIGQRGQPAHEAWILGMAFKFEPGDGADDDRNGGRAEYQVRRR